MGKRVFLFLLTNVAVMVVISAIMYALNIGGVVDAEGVTFYAAVFGICLLWGMGGALISLAISRAVAKWSMGVKVIKGRTGNRKLDMVYEMVERNAKRAGLPMPEVGYYESGEINAFATGPTRKRSLVAVSTGLLSALRPEEVDGVIGHEVAHIANGDMVTMTLLQGVINAFVMFFARLIAMAVRQALDEDYAWFVSFLVYILMTIILSILGSLVVTAFSRRREYRADAGGADYAGRQNMINALKRLASTVDAVDAKSNPAMNAFKISGKKRWTALFSTHPPLQKRIARLERAAR